MGKKLYNVYAWYKHQPAVLVGKRLDITQAGVMVDSYLNRGLEWDAFLVDIDDDPGYYNEEERDI